MPLKCRLQNLGLTHLCTYPVLESWVAQGQSIALKLGRGGGCTHTQPSLNNFANCGRERHMDKIFATSSLLSTCTLIFSKKLDA